MKKKFIVALLACILSISTVACGNTSQKKESSTKQTAQSSSKKKSGKKDVSNAKKDASSDDDENLSQEEWVKKHGNDNIEDGYDKVEKIDITSNTTSFKYTGSKVVDDTDSSGKKILLVYFDFTNINDRDCTFLDHYSFVAYQNGIQLEKTDWASTIDDDESYNNYYKEVLSGATINVGIPFELQDDTSPVKFRADNSDDVDIDNDNVTPLIAQQQEINLQ
nr:MAG TPA: protein of unknown function (DUF5067) [Caudoviricetes sp.]